jgi:large subunit ribosomal protein L13
VKTFIPREQDIQREWLLIDASGEALGRLASRVASILKGKHRPIYTPHIDTGDFVVVVNAAQIAVSGTKMDNKSYFRHSMHPGGWTRTLMRDAMAQSPEWVIRKAVWGMLPHNPLGRQMIRKLKVYSGSSHPHAAQMPKAV